jgi:phosphoribosylformylglycinamidine synthase PurS subunit|tara:strand:+ start:363 stop:578 length:216 start_codon:yes stop_codon:yes gene_type:complete
VRYRITTILKTGILDNAGKATTKALQSLGFDNVNDVRIGKTFELNCNPTDIDKIAQAQTNSVMEEYTIEKI